MRFRARFQLTGFSFLKNKVPTDKTVTANSSTIFYT